MELLTYPKTDYLLNSSLESLHIESQEWLKEIDFWKDEIAFYYNLLNKKSSDKNIPASELKELQRQIIVMTTEKLDAMKNRVRSHEQALAALFKDVVFQEEDFYRESHKKLLKEMYDFHLLSTNFKKQVFSLFHKHT